MDTHTTSIDSTEANPGLCWKCQALLNSQYPEGIITTEIDETRCDPERKTLIRKFKTSHPVEETASEGCLLCLQFLHCLTIPMRSQMQMYRKERESRSEPSCLVFEHSLYISKKDSRHFYHSMSRRNQQGPRLNPQR